MSMKASIAVARVIERMQCDPRLAYLIGPGSQTWDDLTAAYAEIHDVPVDDYRRHLESRLEFQQLPGIGRAWFDPEEV
ncbi:hypothetical protein [Zestomonas carbonaria]|uniref:Uncharacterized protein n=1 Tax=Zestomonas carbonaria TaxID=2762745 RepID=A0A7U7I8F5_9GAMM|nr:hypothetical protein [Pseudomonas carbonaria]CAD5107200.1 hypothetical protein PSEWESI4_01471 [Pseudomonas carbonaria]